MTELIQKTLEATGRACQSSVLYLLKIHNSDVETVAFFGENEEAFSDFNQSIILLAQEDKLKDEEAVKLNSFAALRASFNLNSIKIENILENSESSETFILILFSEFKNAFNDCSAKVAFYADLLKLQIQPEKLNIGKKNGEEDFSGLMETFFEATEDLVFILDYEGCFEKINTAPFSALEYTEEDLIGKHFLDLAAVKEHASIAKAFTEIINNNNIISFETVLLTKYGAEHIFRIKAKAVFKNKGVAGLLGIGKDITIIKENEEKIFDLNIKLIEYERLLSIERSRSEQHKLILEELNKLKGEFVSNISHEFRTPLASIIGFSETILGDPDMPTEMRNEFHQIILDEGKRLAKLINDVLDVSKIEGGEIELNIENFDVVKVLHNVVEEVRDSIVAKGITLTYEYPSEEVIVHADREKISRVYHSILTNAVKFTNTKGRITVLAKSYYKEFEVIISDTGIGIPEKDLPYIFQKFYRVSRPGTEIPGTGLGLVFVKQIVDLHKGFITVQSEVNRGSTFIVKLPKIKKL